MSFKAKDLSYDHENEPAFLRRLRAQNSGFDDRHERATPRPKRIRTDDEDDAPTYVDENGSETLTKSEYEALVAGDKRDTGKDADDKAAKDAELVRGETQGDDPELKASGALPDSGPDDERKQRVAEAGVGSKKRKVAKVVGENDHGEADIGKDANENKDVAPKKKAKKKAKPIKLSFDETAE